MQLLYVMDPMCGWCYGFQPELEAFLDQHPSTEIDWILGGLAPDNSQPMDEKLKNTISKYWYEIEKKSQVVFNHEYWDLNTPYRSTYPACRAVISAETLREGSSQQMVKAIQSAYYREAKNPSLEETLVDCARSIGLNAESFYDVLKSEDTEQRFQQHLSLTQQLRVNGFPALLYINHRREVYPLALGFSELTSLNKQLQHLKDNHLVTEAESF